MTIILELTPEQEQRLRQKAALRGQEEVAFVYGIVEQQLAIDESDPAYLLTLPLEERRRIMTAQFEMAAPLYVADLALPLAEQELTAFTALDNDPILEDYSGTNDR